MDALFQAIRNLGPMRLAVMGGVVLSMVGFFIYITSRLATPNMELLYADLDQKDSGKIVQTLESMQIPYEIAGGGSIKIPGEWVHRRMVETDK